MLIWLANNQGWYTLTFDESVESQDLSHMSRVHGDLTCSIIPGNKLATSGSTEIHMIHHLTILPFGKYLEVHLYTYGEKNI